MTAGCMQVNTLFRSRSNGPQWVARASAETPDWKEREAVAMSDLDPDAFADDTRPLSSALSGSGANDSP